jgi:hypothetical protein
MDLGLPTRQQASNGGWIRRASAAMPLTTVRARLERVRGRALYNCRTHRGQIGRLHQGYWAEHSRPTVATRAAAHNTLHYKHFHFDAE